MTTQTARQRLTSRFATMRAETGLLDMKFHLGSVSETTTEDVCAEVNRMLDSYENSQGFVLVRPDTHNLA